MRDHSVEVIPGAAGSTLRFSDSFNAADVFIDRHLREGRAERVAIRTDSGDSLTYSDLAARVDRCAAGLLSLGMAPGERVLMVLQDTPLFVVLFWAAVKVGIIPVPVNTLLRESDYRFFIENSEAAFVVYSSVLASEVEPALAAAEPAPRHALRVGGDDADLPRPLWGDLGVVSTVAASPGGDCFWLYSSGSTGRPKAAVHAHRDIAVTCQRYAVETLGVRDADVFFSAAKLFFAYGFGNAMTFPLWVGGTAILSASRPSPEMTFEVIERLRPTVYFGVPTLYAAQLRALETGARDLSSLRLCVSAGEALPPHLLEGWQSRVGVPILDGVGSTEALHIYVSNRPGDVEPGASGRPVPGYEVRIVGDEGRPVGLGEAGEMWVRGDSIAKYYWGEAEKTREKLADGWLRSGDTYQCDERGYYYYCGRSDDMLKVGGIWCSPFEIEVALAEHPAVLEAAVVGRADGDRLQKPEAWVVTRDAGAGDDALSAELLAHCKKRLAPYKYPRWVHFVAELPKTATGKIQRFKLRATRSEDE